MHHYASSPQDHLPILVDIKVTKHALNVGTTTIYKWCRDGLLTPIKFGPRCTRFRLNEIQALIDAHAVTASKDGSHE